MSINLLLVDDEEPIRKLLGRLIALEGFQVEQAASLAAARKALTQNSFDVIICDVKLSDGNGIDFVGETRKNYGDTEIILLTAYGNIPDGVTAIKNGAFDYIVKGDDNNKIIPLIHRAAEKSTLAKRVKQLEKQVGKKYSFDSVIGKSRSILATIEMAKKVAATDTTVLLLGETGTGKEVFAQAIHQAGQRQQRNFVAVNCAAFSKELLENELFGHKAGAFTGAMKDEKGLFDEAGNGTIFLDEIGEMSPDLQAKLLRVLETGEFLRLGDTKPVKVNVRVIAATNRDLAKDIESGHFRADLFYRLSVFQINLPPLRDRVMDIETLARHFIEIFSLKTGKKIKDVSADFFEILKKNPWKGNIRELKNIIERSVILSEGDELKVGDLPLDLHIADHNTLDLATAEKLHIQRVLNYTSGNKTKAAQLLEIGLATLYRKMEEYGLSK